MAVGEKRANRARQAWYAESGAFNSAAAMVALAFLYFVARGHSSVLAISRTGFHVVQRSRRHRQSFVPQPGL